MVPDGWNKMKISNILEKVVLPVSVFENDEYREIGIRSHGKGIFYKEKTSGKSLGNKRVFHIEPNCLVLNIVFAWEQAVAKTTESEQGMIASHRFPMYRPKNNLCNIDFILYFLKTKLGKNLLELASPGGAGRNKTLGQSEFARLEISLPSLPEQIKIVEILLTWDKAIGTIEKLLANSEQQKKALMQQLLTGKNRFPGFNKEWKKVHLRDCANCLDNKRIPLNSEQRGEMQGSIPYWGANGVVDFVNEYIFDETIVLLAEDGGYFDEYKTRPIANISYGKCWVNNHAHILYGKENCVNEWLYYSLVHRNLMAFVNGGTRAKLNKYDMMQILITLPPLDEQEKIVKTLFTIDQEIEALKQELDYLKLEKKALMQQILMGKRRVQVN